MDSEDSQETGKEPSEPASPTQPSPKRQPSYDSSDSDDEIPLQPKVDESRDEWSGRESPSPSPESTHSDSLPREALRPARHRRRSPTPEVSPEKEEPQRDPPTEEISDGEMESDQDAEKSGKEDTTGNTANNDENNANMNHEDLSDVSDLDSMGPMSDDEQNKRTKKSPIRAPEQSDKNSLEIKINGNSTNKSPLSNSNTNDNSNSEPTKVEKTLVEKISKMEDAEEQLDFEAEEGECIETPSPVKGNSNNDERKKSSNKKDDDAGSGAASSLEEGEISDNDERRPEETEPRPVCRFYSRGQCTWGISCRFLHPGVTDKGNYTMFDMVRSMPAGYNHHPGLPPHPNHHGIHPPSHMIHPPPPSAHDAIPSESAWERGLRTAKEMMMKANKRREQEPDFEEKKMYLTGGAGGRGGSIGPLDEDDLDLAAYAGYPVPPSPPPVKREYDDHYRHPERRAVYEEVTYASRTKIRYRGESPELTSPTYHRATHYYEEKMDDKLRGTKPRRPKTTREVIVQKVSNESKKSDDWADPWMRSGGTTARPTREHRDKLKPAHGGARVRKYSSGSSYSSSSSSDSSSRSSSSRRSDSRSRRVRRKPSRQRITVSPAMIVQERKAANARAGAMNPPAPTRKRPPSPAAARQYASNPPAPNSKSGVDAFGRAKELKKRQGGKRYSSSSGSDSSSSSSGSDSDSSTSSKSSTEKRPGIRAQTTHKSVQPIDKKPISKVSAPRPPSPKAAAVQKKDIPEDIRKDGAKKRVATSPPASAAPSKKPVSRREELLKQLKAVEEAIARKKTKV